MRRFLNEMLYVVVEWTVIALALGLAAGMTVSGCASDEPHPRAGLHLS